jgi:ubiquinone/menaquinone biosynthesis C-methylase UbiE
MNFKLQSFIFRAWYWYLNIIDKDADLLFMNYGYEDANEKIILAQDDELNRYSIQLYHRLATAVDLKDKNIVEVGCGRGGGLAYITRKFSPSNSLGIDIERRAVNFANKYHQIKGLSFVQGDAHNLPVASNTYDVVLNVESSHRYFNMNLFLSEVSRVLKPKGYFLFTDFRFQHEMPALEEALSLSGLTRIEQQSINSPVLAALNHDTERRKRLVKKLIPQILYNLALDFAGVTNSVTYNRILSGEFVYFLYIFQKK